MGAVPRRGLVVRVRRVSVAADDGPAIGEQAGVGEALRTKSWTSTSCSGAPLRVRSRMRSKAAARTLSTRRPASRWDSSAAGVQRGFEDLDEFGGGEDFDAGGAHEFDSAGVHHGHVGDGAHGGICHGDALHAGGELPRAASCSGQLE